MSTKGHFNPYGKPHAHAGTPERHAGDLPPLKAAKNGRAKVDVMLDVITIAPGPVESRATMVPVAFSFLVASPMRWSTIAIRSSP